MPKEPKQAQDDNAEKMSFSFIKQNELREFWFKEALCKFLLK